MATQGIKNGFLQSDLDARNFTILNLDLTGLNLTKASVGLGNVDNTSDLNKPLSTATINALALKENAITSGTTDQFLIGDKTWLTFGEFALQNKATTLDAVSVIGASAALPAILEARRNDFGGSGVSTSIRHLGASTFGDILTGLPGANVGLLTFRGASFGVVMTNNAAPLVFGTNNIKRARIGLGLSVGTDTEAGSGCILATGTITGTHAGSGAGLTGITKDQIPGTLNATVMPRLSINGVGGAGYVLLGVQTSDPSTSVPHIFGTSAGRVGIGASGSTTNVISFDNGQLTGDCIYVMPNVTAATLVPRVAVPASAGAAGVAGSIAFTAGHAYFCVATNVWQRVAIATF